MLGHHVQKQEYISIKLSYMITLHRWPKKKMVYTLEQPNVNRHNTELSATERIIAAFFDDESKVAKLLNFLSLEENKGSDQFNGMRAEMFKRLFRNHGDAVLAHLRPQLEKGQII